MKDDREIFLKGWYLWSEGWHTETCSYCGGRGLVSDYGSLGEDFYGAKECDKCCFGYVYVTPKGRRVMYPGGPFC